MSVWKRNSVSSLIGLFALLLAFVGAPFVRAQVPTRFVGAVVAINGDTFTVKADAGDVHHVEVLSSSVLKRIAPGQKDLSTAETIQFNEVAVGDRLLVKLDPNAPTGSEQALQIIAVMQVDLALKQEKDREDWQLRGVGGLVKSLDAQSGTIVVSSGVGATAKTITIHITKTTTLKRYAPASVSYDAALPAPITAIHAGDQLRARGSKNADGTEIAAEEVVSGSFRNISGTITSLDAASSTLVVKDLSTKKQITIHITADAQMRRLPDRMAQFLAMRLKGDSTGPVSSTSPQSSNATTGQHGGGQWGGGGDPQQMLSRAPAIHLTDLNKGDAVMLVSTDGTTEVSAITLLAGVEPLLEAPAASQNLLSNWSMGSGTPEAAQ